MSSSAVNPFYSDEVGRSSSRFLVARLVLNLIVRLSTELDEVHDQVDDEVSKTDPPPPGFVRLL